MFIYLASPYSNSPQRNFEKAERFVAQKLKENIVIFSPIVHCHELAWKYALPTEFAFWQQYNFAMLEKAEELWVLELDKWEESKGVQKEIEFAKDNHIPIMMIEEQMELDL